ncbi:MAG: hypothetical protein JWN18_433 [Parcubacteria group bacterium]|nr:hypothetical protein [Parcubacteria group bacterium]
MKCGVVAATAALIFSGVTAAEQFLPDDVDLRVVKTAPKGSFGLSFCGEYVAQSHEDGPGGSPLVVVTILKTENVVRNKKKELAYEFVSIAVDLGRASIEPNEHAVTPIARRHGKSLILQMKKFDAAAAQPCLVGKIT